MPHEARKLIESFGAVARAIQRLAHEELRRADFLSRVSLVMLEFSECDAVDIFFREDGRYHWCTTDSRAENATSYDTIAAAALVELGGRDVYLEHLDDYLSFCCGLLDREFECVEPSPATQTRFWIDGPHRPVAICRVGDGAGEFKIIPGATSPSVAVVPFELENANVGIAVFRHRDQSFFSRERVGVLQSVAHLLGMPIIHCRTQLALRERIKELTCQYEIAKLAGAADAPLADIFSAAVELLPPASLYPECTTARVVVDQEEFCSTGYTEGGDSLRAEICVAGRVRGFVEVCYVEQRPTLSEGPFLREKRHLIDMVARDLTLIVERHRAENHRQQLQEQLRHADRLATIGQLSAGVAHELNEPLGAILGFAQLAQKAEHLGPQVEKDLSKIVGASLHAREVIRKLLLFARQSDRGKGWVDLNALVLDGLHFLESRCQKASVELVREVAPDLPEISADPGQVYQVLINLAVNAIQAMPDGGVLRISTDIRGPQVALVVRDTGIGMSDELMNDIFVPFFTTKDVGEGTGLGLSVVQGIVAAHKGTISVTSGHGAGAEFTVLLPIAGGAHD